MNVQAFSGATQTYGSLAAGGSAWNKAGAAVAGSVQGASGTRITISDQAKALASPDGTAAARLQNIQAKPAAQRSDEEVQFVQRNDERLASILGKPAGERSADEIDHVQKASGLVNTMATLTPQEKQLYDELVAKGDTEAARGMNLIALSRLNTEGVSLPGGKSFNPNQTEISADNVRQLFSRMFVGTDGQDAKSFEALARYLDGRASAVATTAD